MNKLVIEVPFEGFYQTSLGEAVEAEIDNQLENRGLDFDEVGSVDVDRDSIAKNWLEIYSQQISEALGIEDIMLSFAELVSPTYYNFQNDRIIANITEDKLVILRDAMQKLYSLEHLQAKAEDLFLSRDGFISFNSELAKPENWNTLENPFIGLLWLPSASEFYDVTGYDLEQHIIEELYMQGIISDNINISEDF